MPRQNLKRLQEHHVEVARLLALGKSPTSIGKATGIALQTISMWRHDPLMAAKIKEYMTLRDAGVAVAFGPNPTAKSILKGAELDAVNRVVLQMREGRLPVHRYQAALEILKLLGYYATEKSGQIIINISGAEVREMRDGMQRVKLAEPAKFEALPEPEESSAEPISS